MVYLSVTKQINIINDKIPARFNIAIMLFFACFISYMLRVNLSINILAMVEPIKLNENKTLAIAPDYGPRYNWSTSDQSILLGAYFWGYLLTALPGGILAEWCGGRAVVGYSIGASAIVTALIPFGAQLSFWVVYTLRALTGFLGGVLYPALHNLVSKWSPPEEKGKFISSLLGGSFGTVVTWPLAGLLVETVGWVWAFYVPALLTGVVTLIWFYIVADTPNDHPRIRQDEKEYIVNCIGVSSVTSKKSWPPFLSLCTSMPFLALTLLHYGNLWGLFFLITAAPMFMSEVLGFNLAQAGVLASLPYLARLFAGFAFGALGDVIRKKKLMHVTTVRKFFCIFSHIIPGLLLMGLAYIGNNPYLCVTIITLSLGLNGSSTLTNLQNTQDLAPNFAGSVYGIINVIGITAGFITPLVVGHFTAKGNTIDQWGILFIIGAVAYILPALFFIIFGSGEVQPWNDLPTKKTDDDKLEKEKPNNTVV